MALWSSEILSEDEVIREATLEDYQDVLDIEPNGFGGCDYLPATYSSLVRGQGVKGYVYLKANKVVGFISTKEVDAGTTVMTSGGRVHADHRGVGIYGRLHRTVVKPFAASPNCHRVVFTVDNEGMGAFSQRFGNYIQVMKKDLTCTAVHVDELRAHISLEADHTTDHLQPLTHHHLRSMLSCPPSNLRHLFPEQRILLNWEPYRVMADNADVIIDNCIDHVFVAATGELASVGKGNNFPVTLMSCGSHFPCQRGRMYVIDLFGSGSKEEVYAHLVWHLQRVTKVAKEKTAVIHTFANFQFDNTVARLQARFSVQPVAVPYNPLAAFVLETAFHH